jgi:hypothetical protein
MVSAASKTDMMNAVLRLVQCNTLVHTINMPDHAKDEEFFQNFIIPRLEMNRNCFEDQRQALKRAYPSIRGQLLGRAFFARRPFQSRFIVSLSLGEYPGFCSIGRGGSRHSFWAEAKGAALMLRPCL